MGPDPQRGAFSAFSRTTIVAGNGSSPPIAACRHARFGPSQKLGRAVKFVIPGIFPGSVKSNLPIARGNMLIRRTLRLHEGRRCNSEAKTLGRLRASRNTEVEKTLRPTGANRSGLFYSPGAGFG